MVPRVRLPIFRPPTPCTGDEFFFGRGGVCRGRRCRCVLVVIMFALFLLVFH